MNLDDLPHSHPLSQAQRRQGQLVDVDSEGNLVVHWERLNRPPMNNSSGVSSPPQEPDKSK